MENVSKVNGSESNPGITNLIIAIVTGLFFVGVMVGIFCLCTKMKGNVPDGTPVDEESCVESKKKDANGPTDATLGMS